jgi:hypothetical protein
LWVEKGINCRNTLHRSSAVVIAYLMKYKQWRLPQAYQWVKDRRPSINLTQGMAAEHGSILCTSSSGISILKIFFAVSVCELPYIFAFALDMDGWKCAR